ncbi:MAG: Aspartate--tRNA ligase [Alphaproteobacteria bacterium MarineAlpha3_Bin7]|nr:MAG: Aspartate--tRNA ligase [Alphaproteobacteria bacterium MarineAlpha3_Bin7]
MSKESELHPYRTHNCGELRKESIGEIVRLSGWVHRIRDHGNLLFVDLRDNFGFTQLVVEADSTNFESVNSLKPESVITVTGVAEKRSSDTINTNILTGEIEVRIQNITIDSVADVLPFPVSGNHELPEELRLKYRFLDLRREALSKNIKLRSNIISSIRNRMVNQGFQEFQTPILTASSPEGARDYLVPSRIHTGKFYALPQAPQIFKQLIMVSGFDKYFQIAPCFRDEDARADRSPGEFYQLDVEMSFCTQEDVFQNLEPVLSGVFEEFSEGKAVTSSPFPQITYKDSMLKYGSDKPDLRNPIIIYDVSDEFRDSNFGIFAKIVAAGGVVRAIPAVGSANNPRSFFDKLNDWAREEGFGGLGYIMFNDDEGKGPIARNLESERSTAIRDQLGLTNGDSVFFVANLDEVLASKFAGQVRNRVCDELGLLTKDSYEFCWIVDYPMYEKNVETGEVEFSHNPFSMPQGGMEALINKDPLDILAYQFDIVCNGVELSSGAIRNHRPEIMYKAFEIAGYGKEVVEEKFSSLLNAFKFGAPPHGGSAPGIDRIVMLLAGEPNIREVILFPMNQQAEDLMMGAPAEISKERYRELHLKHIPTKKEKTIK